MNKSSYYISSIEKLAKLREEFSSGNITEQEYEILIGLLIEKEFSENIKSYVNRLLPKQKRTGISLGFINYEKRRLYANR